MAEPDWLRQARAKGLAITEGPPAGLGAAAPAAWFAPLAALARAAGFSEPVAEHGFHPVRKWRFDWAFLPEKVACEREGGDFRRVACGCGRSRTVFVSRHHSRQGLEDDAEKYGTAAGMGWAVVRATPGMIRDGRAAALLLAALHSRRVTKQGA